MNNMERINHDRKRWAVEQLRQTLIKKSIIKPGDKNYKPKTGVV